MSEKQWYFLMFDLERSQAAARVAFSRHVAKTNVVRVQNSVYAVEAAEDGVESLMRLAADLKGVGADVIVVKGTLCAVAGAGDSPEEDLMRMLGVVLDKKYERIRNDARSLNEEARKAKTRGEALKYVRRLKAIRELFDNVVESDTRDVISNKRNLAEAEITDAAAALQKKKD